MSVLLKLRHPDVICNLNYTIVYSQAKEKVWLYPDLKEMALAKGKRTSSLTGNSFRRLDIYEERKLCYKSPVVLIQRKLHIHKVPCLEKCCLNIFIWLALDPTSYKLENLSKSNCRSVSHVHFYFAFQRLLSVEKTNLNGDAIMGR